MRRASRRRRSTGFAHTATTTLRSSRSRSSRRGSTTSTGSRTRWGWGGSHFDSRDHIALEYAVHNGHPRDHLAEHRVVVVEAGVVHEVDEDLRVACVSAPRGGAQGPAG